MSHATAALAIAIGVLANTAVKAGIALLFGTPRFRASAGGTLLLMIAAAILLIM